ncbi:hypothetical protein GCM10022226_64000 [Sphaerisporangium flaviroseum]|uniref:Tox-PL domain-containing protein n=2 Tax=Sphaerisporangium flaviroseum TaxID=509199 RepID=A0ABP7J4H8_9ACTN
MDLDDLPGPFRSLVPYLTGGIYPDAEVDELVAASEALAGCAEWLKGVREQEVARVDSLLGDVGWQGAAQEQFAELWKGLGGQGSAPVGVAEFVAQIEQAIAVEAEALREHAVRTQYTQWMTWATLIALAIAIVALIWNPAGWAVIQPRVLLTRLSLEQLKRQVLINMLKFGAISGGMDLGVQAAQMVAPGGIRETGDFDWSSIGMSTATGLAGGALFSGLGFAAARLPHAGLAGFSQGIWGQAAIGGVSNVGAAVPLLALSGDLDGTHLLQALTSGVVGSVGPTPHHGDAQAVPGTSLHTSTTEGGAAPAHTALSGLASTTEGGAAPAHTALSGLASTDAGHAGSLVGGSEGAAQSSRPGASSTAAGTHGESRPPLAQSTVHSSAGTLGGMGTALAGAGDPPVHPAAIKSDPVVPLRTTETGPAGTASTGPGGTIDKIINAHSAPAHSPGESSGPPAWAGADPGAVSAGRTIAAATGTAGLTIGESETLGRVAQAVEHLTPGSRSVVPGEQVLKLAGDVGLRPGDTPAANAVRNLVALFDQAERSEYVRFDPSRATTGAELAHTLKEFKEWSSGRSDAGWARRRAETDVSYWESRSAQASRDGVPSTSPRMREIQTNIVEKRLDLQRAQREEQRLLGEAGPKSRRAADPGVGGEARVSPPWSQRSSLIGHDQIVPARGDWIANQAHLWAPDRPPGLDYSLGHMSMILDPSGDISVARMADNLYRFADEVGIDKGDPHTVKEPYTLTELHRVYTGAELSGVPAFDPLRAGNRAELTEALKGYLEWERAGAGRTSAHHVPAGVDLTPAETPTPAPAHSPGESSGPPAWAGADPGAVSAGRTIAAATGTAGLTIGESETLGRIVMHVDHLTPDSRSTSPGELVLDLARQVGDLDRQVGLGPAETRAANAVRNLVKLYDQAMQSGYIRFDLSGVPTVGELAARLRSYREWHEGDVAARQARLRTEEFLRRQEAEVARLLQAPDLTNRQRGAIEAELTKTYLKLDRAIEAEKASQMEAGSKSRRVTDPGLGGAARYSPIWSRLPDRVVHDEIAPEWGRSVARYANVRPLDMPTGMAYALGHMGRILDPATDGSPSRMADQLYRFADEVGIDKGGPHTVKEPYTLTELHRVYRGAELSGVPAFDPLRAANRAELAEALKGFLQEERAVAGQAPVRHAPGSVEPAPREAPRPTHDQQPHEVLKAHRPGLADRPRPLDIPHAGVSAHVAGIHEAGAPAHIAEAASAGSRPLRTGDVESAITSPGGPDLIHEQRVVGSDDALATHDLPSSARPHGRSVADMAGLSSSDQMYKILEPSLVNGESRRRAFLEFAAELDLTASYIPESLKRVYEKAQENGFAPELSRNRAELVDTLKRSMAQDPMLWRGYNSKLSTALGEADDAAFRALGEMSTMNEDFYYRRPSELSHIKIAMKIGIDQWVPELVKMYQHAQAEGFMKGSFWTSMLDYRDSDPLLWKGRETAHLLGRYTELSDEAYRGLARMGQITGMDVPTSVRGGANPIERIAQELELIGGKWSVVELYRRAEEAGLNPASARDGRQLVDVLKRYAEMNPTWETPWLPHAFGEEAQLTIGGGRVGGFPAKSGIAINIVVDAKPDIVGDVGHLPLRTASIDRVYFECVPFTAFTGDNRGALAAVARVLRPGGELRLLTGSLAPIDAIREDLTRLGFIDIKINNYDGYDITARTPASTE